MSESRGLAPIGPQLRDIARLPGRAIKTLIVGRSPPYEGTKQGYAHLRRYARHSIADALAKRALTDEGAEYAKREGVNAFFRSSANVSGLIVSDILALTTGVEMGLVTYGWDAFMKHLGIDTHLDVGNHTRGIRLADGKTGMIIAGTNFVAGDIISQIPFVNCLALPLAPLNTLLAYHIDAVRQAAPDLHSMQLGVQAAIAAGRKETQIPDKDKPVLVDAMKLFGATLENQGVDLANALSNATPIDPNKFI